MADSGRDDGEIHLEDAAAAGGEWDCHSAVADTLPADGTLTATATVREDARVASDSSVRRDVRMAADLLKTSCGDCDDNLLLSAAQCIIDKNLGTYPPDVGSAVFKYWN